jgi:hypothetical protein
VTFYQALMLGVVENVELWNLDNNELFVYKGDLWAKLKDEAQVKQDEDGKNYSALTGTTRCVQITRNDTFCGEEHNFNSYANVGRFQKK